MRRRMKGVTAETERQRWEREVLEPALQRAPERDVPFTTISGRAVERLYTPDDLPGFDYSASSTIPANFPTPAASIRPAIAASSGRCASSPGSARPKRPTRATRRCSKAGGTGLSVAFDLPTLMGRDPDHELSLGEVGKCGVSVMSLADMETLFEGIPLADITTSMTINSPAAMIFAMYLVVAEKQGADWKKISGTIQNDILKEFIAQKEYIYPPRPSMRLITDIFAFCSNEVPRWNTISVSGYHIREAGATAVQELAFTLRDGIEYVQWGVDAGLDVDDFVPRISFFFNAHSDFFEEIAKYRAARKIWAEVMRDRFGAKNERSWKLRFHTPDGRRLADRATAIQQRRADGAAGALRRPRRHQLAAHELARRGAGAADRGAATLALRTQQIIAHESGVANVVDPLGGSYFVERLTLDMERGALNYSTRSIAMGGMVEAIEEGYPQREIAEASYKFQQAFERREKIMVGVNEYVQDEEPPFPILYIDESTAEKQLARLADLKRTRDNDAVRRSLDALAPPREGTSIRCTLSSTAFAPTRPSARCAIPCARHGGNIKRSRSRQGIRDSGFGIRDQKSARAPKVPGCQSAKVPKCQSAKVSKCQSAEVPKCEVPKCRSAKVPGCWPES